MERTLEEMGLQFKRLQKTGRDGADGTDGAVLV